MDKEIKITKSELRKKSSEFRMYANRLMHTQIDEGMKNLKRFIDIIDKDLIISDFLKKRHTKEFDIQSICVTGNSYMGYHIPDDSPESEITFTYQLLQYGLQTYYNDDDGYWHLAATKETYMGDMDRVVSKFNYSVVKPFIYHIEKYLSDLQIDLGDDESRTLSIHIYGNMKGDIMPNNSSDINIKNVTNSNVNAAVGDISGTVNNAINQLQASENSNAIQLAELLNQLKTAIEAESGLPADDKEVALEQVAVLASEGENPNKESSFKPVKTAIAALKGTATALPAAAELVKEFNQILPLIGQIFGLG
jgi:hypothetical protein